MPKRQDAHSSPWLKPGASSASGFASVTEKEWRKKLRSAMKRHIAAPANPDHDNKIQVIKLNMECGGCSKKDISRIVAEEWEAA